MARRSAGVSGEAGHGQQALVTVNVEQEVQGEMQRDAARRPAAALQTLSTWLQAGTSMASWAMG